MNHPPGLSRRSMLGSPAVTTTGALDMTLGSAAVSEIHPIGKDVVQAQTDNQFSCVSSIPWPQDLYMENRWRYP